MSGGAMLETFLTLLSDGNVAGEAGVVIAVLVFFGAIFCTFGNSLTGTGLPTTLNLVAPLCTNMMGLPGVTALAGEVMGPGTAAVVVVEAGVGFQGVAVVLFGAAANWGLPPFGSVDCCCTNIGWLMPGIFNTIG